MSLGPLVTVVDVLVELIPILYAIILLLPGVLGYRAMGVFGTFREEHSKDVARFYYIIISVITLSIATSITALLDWYQTTGRKRDS